MLLTIMVVSGLSNMHLRAGVNRQENELNTLFENKKYEELQVIVDSFFHAIRNDLYKFENSWFSSGDNFGVSQKIDSYHFFRKWLLSRVKDNLCSWAYFNLFRDAMRSFKYPVKNLESYGTLGLKKIFSWMIFFNFLHIGLVKYYRQAEKLNKKWYASMSPADFFKNCCHHRITTYEKYIPTDMFPSFSDCWKEAMVLLMQQQVDFLHDYAQLLFIYNNSWTSNWFYQKNPTEKIIKLVSLYSAQNSIKSVFQKACNHFNANFSYSPKWSDFWKLSEKDIKCD